MRERPLTRILGEPRLTRLPILWQMPLVLMSRVPWWFRAVLFLAWGCVVAYLVATQRGPWWAWFLVAAIFAYALWMIWKRPTTK